MVQIKWEAQSLLDLQLDIVGFLAILGEGSVLQSAQVAFLSKWAYVPRLIPAPQALFRTERPERLAPSVGKVVGSHSGNVRDKLNHVAHVLHEEGDKLQSYAVQVVSLEEDKTKEQVKARTVSPITGLSLLGASMAAALLILSIVQGDGFSLIATLFLSSLSSIIGIGSKWELKLPSRQNDRPVPNSDVIISYPHGAFLVVKCDENIARRLYWAPESCDYHISTSWYRFISLTGTLLLMGGVITLANASNELQVAWAVAYMILNAAYWIVAALPPRWNWQIDSFRVGDVKTRRLGASLTPPEKDPADFQPRGPSRQPTDLRKAGTARAPPKAEDNVGGKNKSFTEALWHAIAVSKSSQWARIASIAPNTSGWDRWLELAEEQAKKTEIHEEEGENGERIMIAQVPDWNPSQVLTGLLSQQATAPPIRKSCDGRRSVEEV